MDFNFSLPNLSNTSRAANLQQNSDIQSSHTFNYNPNQNAQNQGYSMNSETLIRDVGLQNYRDWYTLRMWSRGPVGEYRLMSYNVLADHCVRKTRYLYSCNEEDLDLHKRSKYIIDEIKYYSPDLLALQEVDDGFENYAIMHGYASVYKKRMGNDLDGTMNLWKTSKFTLLERFDVEYKSDDQQLSDHLDKFNVGIITVLRLNSDMTKVIIFANTHLLYNPDRGDKQLCQLIVMLKSIEAITQRYLEYQVSVTLTGDFNLTPCGGIYHLIENKNLDLTRTSIKDLSGRYKGLETCGLTKIWSVIRNPFQYLDRNRMYSNNSGLAHIVNSISIGNRGYTIIPKYLASNTQETTITHNIDLKSAYKECIRSEPFPTTYLNKSKSTVDYIWYSGNFQPTRVLMTPRYDHLSHWPGAPNETIPSDHFPLVTDFNL